MAYTPAINAISWICVCFMIGKNQAHSASACFGNNQSCNRFNITCDDNTIIRITGAEYCYTDSSGTPSQSCNLTYNNCKANYSYNHAVILFNRCSGKKSCSNNLVPQPTDHACKNYTGAKYGHVTYDCIHYNETVDMCQADVNATSEVNIILKAGNAKSDPVKCSCYVEAKEKVMYQLVDVRLFTNVHDTEGKYDCVPSIFQVNNNTSIKCKNSSDNSFAYMNSSNFEGELGYIQNLKEVLQLTYTERPKMVWVHLKAQPSGTFNIQCKTVSSITTTETPSTERGSTILSATTTTASDKLPVGETDKDKSDDGKSLPIIVGVVVAAIILIAVVSSALIILKRRQKKPQKDDSPKSEAPSCFINRTFKCIDDSGKSYATVEYSTYDSINDESVATYIPPVKKMKDDRSIHEDTTAQGGEVSADEYDRIQFKKEFAKTIPNYDHLPTMGGNIRNDTHSHVSNQSEFANAATANASEYSHCKLSSKKIQRNDDDYSHVDLEEAWKKHKHPDSIEEGSYSHIDFA